MKKKYVFVSEVSIILFILRPDASNVLENILSPIQGQGRAQNSRSDGKNDKNLIFEAEGLHPSIYLEPGGLKHA